MAISTSLQLKLNPNTGTYKTGDWLDITGSNFGGAPNVVLFDPVQLVDGQAIRLNSPKVGTYTDVSTNAFAVAENGEFWLPMRDPTQVNSASKNAVTLGFETTPFTQFFWFHRVMGQTGKYFPFATTVGGAPNWAETNMKPWWFTTSNNGNEVDLVAPTYGGSGAQQFGNTNGIRTSTSTDDVPVISYPRSTDMFVTKSTCFGFYQSGDESTYGAMDATVNIQRYDDAGFAEVNVTGDPFASRSPTTLTPTVQNSATYNVIVNGVTIPNSYVSDASATLAEILDGIVASINSNSSEIRAVKSAGSTQVRVYAINTANSLTITASANIAVTINSPILGASQYFRLQWASFTNTPAGGWVNVQMLTNWMYLATGANAFAGIFLGDAPTLAGCKDVRPFLPDLWTDTRIVIDKMGFSGYVHQRHANGTVQNNIMGGIV